MPFWLLAGVGVGLAMDAFAVAVCVSVNLPRTTPRQIFRLSFHFGFFQAVMPLLGWISGRYTVSFMAEIDHWVVFLLLCGIGLHALWGAWADSEDKEKKCMDPTRGWHLISLSLATSVDAFAVGLSFAMLSVNLWYAAALIGIITAGLTMFGMFFGSMLGRCFGTASEVFGGLILIGIGFKILVDHLMNEALPF
ncbi:MAG: manganese efflux pump [Candidatus Hydrogenedentes bacterium]|jgi:putative Mn2+ efflux pump MntP|nr:manganese efflux pump [Candidatus Hydrogenedentota bacterium]